MNRATPVRSSTLQVRCADMELASFTRAARAAGLSLSAWCRSRLLAAALGEHFRARGVAMRKAKR
jgi:hypothetical protein